MSFKPIYAWPSEEQKKRGVYIVLAKTKVELNENYKPIDGDSAAKKNLTGSKLDSLTVTSEGRA